MLINTRLRTIRNFPYSRFFDLTRTSAVYVFANPTNSRVVDAKPNRTLRVTIQSATVARVQTTPYDNVDGD